MIVLKSSGGESPLSLDVVLMVMITNSLYNNIIPPSQLPQKANYYLFKEGIIPAWEDEANKNGGKWSIQLPKDKNRANVDKMWLYTVSFVTCVCVQIGLYSVRYIDAGRDWRNF